MKKEIKRPTKKENPHEHNKQQKENYLKYLKEENPQNETSKTFDSEEFSSDTKITIYDISGQSMFKHVFMECKFSSIPPRALGKMLGQILGERFDYDWNLHTSSKIFVDCEDEEMKLEIIQQALKVESQLEFSPKELHVGGDWGLNIHIKLPTLPKGKEWEELVEENTNVTYN